MEATISEFRNCLLKKVTTLNKRERKYIHFNSLKNFLIHYDRLPDHIKVKSAEILLDYYRLLIDKNWVLNLAEAKQIYLSHVIKIGSDYNHYLQFQVLMSLRSAVLGGLLIDVFLLVVGILKNIWFVPITTLILTGYNRYLMLKYEKINKLYGPLY